MSGPSTSPEYERLAIVDHPERGRYELHLDAEVVAYADYSIADAVVTIPHVETAPKHRGKDFAARLMGGVVADVRERSLTIRPLCGYADAYMHRHPDTNDLRA